MKTNYYYLIIGGNLGDRVSQLAMAKQLISSEVGSVKAASSIYETQPWGHEDQPWFLNQALKVSSTITPGELLPLIKTIESKLGRTPTEKWHARHIDIDILLYGQFVHKTKELELPHPLLHIRNFVLVPLMELAPELNHPILNKSIEDLYMECRDTGEVYLFNEAVHGDAV